MPRVRILTREQLLARGFVETDDGSLRYPPGGHIWEPSSIGREMLTRLGGEHEIESNCGGMVPEEVSIAGYRWIRSTYEPIDFTWEEGRRVSVDVPAAGPRPIQVGDRVRLLPPAPGMSSHPGYSERMEHLVDLGGVHTVDRITHEPSNWFTVIGSGWTWSEEMVERVVADDAPTTPRRGRPVPTSHDAARGDILRRKREFATESPILGLKRIRCGFELETQAVDGLTYGQFVGDDSSDDDSSPEFDEDAWGEYVDAQVRGFLARSWAEVLERWTAGTLRIDGRHCSTTGFVGNRIRGLRDQMVEDGHEPAGNASVADVADECGHRGRVESKVAEWCHDYLCRDDFYSTPDSSGGGDSRVGDVPHGIEAKHDGSVDGPEFVVAGSGVPAARFSKLLRELLDTFSLRVDTACSFHIHVSVPGIRHKYGRVLQLHMMEYLLSQVHRVPGRVLDRWKRDTAYFRPQLSTEKYSFVHFHSNLGTWEFRCFGNVQSHADGMRCLRLAVEALQYAYRVQLGLEQAKHPDESTWSVDNYTAVVARGESLDSSLKKSRIKRARSESDAA